MIVTEIGLRLTQLEKQNADLRELIRIIGQRLVVLERRPIVGIGPDSPRVYDGSLIQKFDDLYAKGEVYREHEEAGKG